MFNPYIIPICFNFITWIRENLFEPLIELVANIFVTIFIEAFKVLLNLILLKFCALLYAVYVVLLKFLDMLQDIFDLISGTNEIYYAYTSNGVTERGSGYITEILMKIPSVQNAFLMVWGISIVLCVIFAVAAIIRSMGNLSGNCPSVNEVLKSLANTLVLFCSIQVITFGTLALANLVTSATQKAINYAMTDDDSDARFSNYLFAATAMNARRTTSSSDDDSTTFIDVLLGNAEYNGDWDTDDTLQEYVRGEKSYTSDVDVAKDFMIYKIDYVSGAIVLVFVLKFMVGASFVYIERIVSVIVGFVTAPFFVALTPLDGGDRFNRWKDYYIGNCFSAIGVILAVRIYLMLLPIFLANDFIDTGVDMLNYFVKVYGIVMLSIALQECTGVFNKILSDAVNMTPGGAFRQAADLVKAVMPEGNKGGDGQGQGGSGQSQGGGGQGQGGSGQSQGEQGSSDGGEQSGGASAAAS
ncbi:MAG: hypothetical protein LUG66_03175 [Clostridiales bacterium]|nr:hypothetical protein [Clostridiales bacterium]